MRRRIQDRQPTQDTTSKQSPRPVSLASKEEVNKLQERITQKDIALINVKAGLAEAEQKLEAQDSELDNLTEELAQLTEKLQLAEDNAGSTKLPSTIKIEAFRDGITGNGDFYNLKVELADKTELTLTLTWPVCRKMFQKIKQLNKKVEDNNG